MVLAGYARVERTQELRGDEIARREDELYRALITADAFPHLRAAIDSGVFLDESDPFSFGLARSLDGVEAYIAGVNAGRRDAPQPWVHPDDADVADDKRYREAQRRVRDAEKALREARRIERQAAREARERMRRSSAS